MDWPVAAIIITAIVSLLTVIVRYLQARNKSGNPGNSGTFVSDKECKALMKGQEASVRGVHHRIGELEKNLGGRIGTLETSINNLIKDVGRISRG